MSKKSRFKKKNRQLSCLRRIEEKLRSPNLNLSSEQINKLKLEHQNIIKSIELDENKYKP